ncbi:cation:proton antiporter family protein [Euzebya rosea]|uniref:cation:proton antiporter family protein n=1 Tax=Euzebya rosea TaxID=2052804 RepID=UPI000D3E2FA8|nr:cation:proton antiporter family protein [Euzebya rosea]
MDIALLLAAFGFGFLARTVGLPPLIGYIAAGFVLHGFGFEATSAIEVVADVGILLLLFGIGLKLRVRTLAAPQVWGTATAFAVLATAGMAGLLWLVGWLGLPLAADLDPVGLVVIGFAFSFCSTVFTVKVLEQGNETASVAGRVAIGVLILQDVFAVAFLVAVGGTQPSPWALLVVPAFLIVGPLLGWLLDRVGHGETLVLLGFTAAVGVGAELFSLVDLKPDLGALVAGILLANHRRAPELASRLLDFKDLLLVGFFLSIGLAGIPTGPAWAIGGIVLVVLPLRTLLLVWLFTRFRLRARTSLGAALHLSTHSEFGLIVAAAALGEGLIDEEWLAALAVAVGLSFVAASIGGRLRYALHGRVGDALASLERHPTVAEDAVIDIADARILVFGMGRVGTGAFDELVIRRGNCVLGVDVDEAKLLRHVGRGRNVIRGDALDRDFWERVRLHPDVELVVVTMGRHHANVECVKRVREFLPDVRIAAVANYPDQVAELQAAGVDVARNLHEEAGQALADDTLGAIHGT